MKPFDCSCGSKSTVLSKHLIMSRKYWVHCFNCGKDGQSSFIEDNAVKAWNKRITLVNKQKGEKS